MHLDKIQEWVAITQDLSISKTALHGLIWDAGVTYKVLHKGASEHEEEAWERFCDFARNHLVASTQDASQYDF